MAKYTLHEAEQLIRSGAALDTVAATFRAFIVGKPNTQTSSLAVEFRPLSTDTFDFIAIIHRVHLLVKYEHEIGTGPMGNLLRGVWRVYRHEPLNAKPTELLAITFNSRGIAKSPGDAVECLTPDEMYQDTVRLNFTALLAQHVLEMITVEG